MTSGNWLPGCTKKYNIVAGDSCYDVAARNGIALAMFYQLNPGLKCETLAVNQLVCLAADVEKKKETEIGRIAVEKPVSAKPSNRPMPTQAGLKKPLPTQAGPKKPLPPNSGPKKPLPPNSGPKKPAPSPKKPSPWKPRPSPKPQPPALDDKPDNDSGFPNGNNGLAAHNNERSKYGVKPLSWDGSLAAGSLSYAKTLASNNCQLTHSSGDYGENLYAMWGGSPSMNDAVTAWINEPKDGKTLNHWTQVVWHDSTKVGCGYARGNGCVSVVCRYNPP